jgi:hypothetical protein
MKEGTSKGSGGPPPATRRRCALLEAHRDRLKRMVHLRLIRRLSGRVDDSDVLQEAFAEVARKLPRCASVPKPPLLLWMRQPTALRLAPRRPIFATGALSIRHSRIRGARTGEAILSCMSTVRSLNTAISTAFKLGVFVSV